jgi:hypothetical protein
MWSLDGSNKGRVALLDDVVELDLGHQVLLQSRGISSFATAKRTSDLLCDRLVLAELGEKRLVEQILDVLGVVEGRQSGRALGDLLLVARLARVYALEDA